MGLIKCDGMTLTRMGSAGLASAAQVARCTSEVFVAVLRSVLDGGGRAGIELAMALGNVLAVTAQVWAGSHTHESYTHLFDVHMLRADSFYSCWLKLHPSRCACRCSSGC